MPESLGPELTAFYTWFETTKQYAWRRDELREAFLAGHKAALDSIAKALTRP